MLAWVLAVVMCVCVCVCHVPVLYRNSCTDRADCFVCWFSLTSEKYMQLIQFVPKKRPSSMHCFLYSHCTATDPTLAAYNSSMVPPRPKVH